MRKVRKFAFLMSIILLFSIFYTTISAGAAFNPNFTLSSDAVYMVNLDTDIVIVSKNADKKMYPASTTKIMTALLTLENVTDLNANAFCSYSAFNEFSSGNPNFEGPSNAAIEPKQSNITYKDLLYSLLISSACESANILAYNIGGDDIDNFVAMMNKKATEIGCKNTHFSNPHGLYAPDNYTTAYDLYLITKYCYDKFPLFAEICDNTSYVMPANNANPAPYEVVTTNKLMVKTSEYYYEYAHGIKTGSIDYYYEMSADGTYTGNKEYGSRALVTTAKKDGFSYMIVSLGAPYFDKDGVKIEQSLPFIDHKKLYEWAFSTFEYKLVVDSKENIMSVDVEKGENADFVNIRTPEDYYTLLPKSLDKSTIQRILPTIDTLTAPVEKGELLGKMELKLNGETLAVLDLMTESDVELSMTAYYTDKIKEIVNTGWFQAAVIIMIALIVVFCVARGIQKSRKQKRNDMNRRRKTGFRR